METVRLRLKPKANLEKIRKMLNGIEDKRFKPLQKCLAADLEKAHYKNINLALYMRLGGWSHTSGTYCNPMFKVRLFCKTIFGYELPEQIKKIHLKDHHYQSAKGLAKIASVIKEFHDKAVK